MATIETKRIARQKAEERYYKRMELWGKFWQELAKYTYITGVLGVVVPALVMGDFSSLLVVTILGFVGLAFVFGLVGNFI